MTRLSFSPIFFFLMSFLFCFHIEFTWADDKTKHTKEMALRHIMKNLDKQMQIAKFAINNKNWPLLQQSAMLIAEHPQPPFNEKLRIMAFMGRNITLLKELDEDTHQAAKNLAAHVATGQYQNINNAYLNLEKSCNNCHDRFREAFVKHFYPQTVDDSSRSP